MCTLFLIRRPTFTWPPSSATRSTEPTDTPATRTSSPGRTMPASGKFAVYVVVPMGRTASTELAIISTRAVATPRTPKVSCRFFELGRAQTSSMPEANFVARR